MDIQKTFKFRKVSESEVIKNINYLDSKKAYQASDISSKTLLENKNILAKFITKNYNYDIKNELFPDPLKHFLITSDFKKDCPTEKPNYRPISILSNISNKKRL